ncbi:hypothetical protein [Lacinutrix venerupis]|uniref:DUF4890 domain-containing protein n=1 Tax=Lacinutrix venerupis TaxID=1486034 RepID=A0AAC9LLJ9_9FLAO|nr:hypothetical protein [Lacinutrix venerupis]APX99546.1 hypothetical protein BWR22_04185 [Lacinutrix venerupis]
MKKLLIVAVALFALQINAQDKKENKKELRKEKMEQYRNMDSKEIAALQTKKMTLALDLTPEQQSKVEQINIKNADLRKAAMEKRMAAKDTDKKLSPEDKLKRENERLDQEIATKREMKAILTPEQYEKYSKMSKRRGNKGMRGKMKGKKGEKKEHKMEKE